MQLADVGIGSPAGATLGLVHGLTDPIVPYDHSRRFKEAAEKAGVECSYRPVKREGHFEVLEPQSTSWQEVKAIIAEAWG